MSPSNPAPDRYEATHLAAEVAALPDGDAAALAGRVVLYRPLGALTFGHLQDRSGRVQFSLRRETVGEQRLAELGAAFGMGDFVGIRGAMWTTRRGERTLDAQELVVLQRAARPMPDKWAGVRNREIVYRKRYLDLLYNPESRARFALRRRTVAAIRRFLDERGFAEVETPILQPAASGASARPFLTHHNALDRELFLRISPETYLKRLVAGGMDRVYELGRNFRNEGMDASHLQEFTMLEWYVAYWNYRDNMTLVRELVQSLLTDLCGGLVLEVEGRRFDFSGSWPEVDYRTAVREQTGIDLREVRDVDTLRRAIRATAIEVDNLDADHPSYAGLVDLLYKRTVRPRLVQPTFLVHHPAELVPLARRSDGDPTRLDMFQVVVGGWEIVKAYSELVDPVEQRARLEEQVALRSAGDEEAMMLEEDFVEAMEYGMPPMSGLGLGVDRLVALMTGAPNLRDVVFFPQMRDEAAPPIPP
ncbi:MAG: lysine--tRNA ligase [Candidatus Dormibacteria bacterium]